MAQPCKADIVFENVHFVYPGVSDSAALIDFSLDVKPGETVAFVGPSGSGKTTIFHLLLRFYNPSKGRILFDGLDLSRLDLNELRQQIGIVPQEPVIFSASVYENILYGRPDATPEEVQRAAQMALVDEFARRLPQGLHTYLGSRGVTLSGGQKQRIAIARAILRNPSLLLLDEATSALDAQSERYVQQALDGLMDGRTTLVVAHRLSTTLKADKIVVVNHGKIEAVGTHSELVHQGGLYSKLAGLQFVRDTV